jgi:hypothetical protein
MWRLTDQNVVLAQRLALLEAKLRERESLSVPSVRGTMT